ncbi:MAG: type IV pilus inner membrane component PilO [Endomicrobiales bacterium]
MTKKMQKDLLMLAILIIGGVFAYYKYLMGPLKENYRASLDTLKQTETRLSEMKRRAIELPKLQAEMTLLEQEVASLEQLLPKDKEIPGLLRTITKTAHRHQLRITNITPSGVIPLNNYNEVPFQITMQGNYHSLAKFLTELGQESRILSARNILFGAGSTTKETGTLININFTLVAYTFKG